MPSVGKQVGAPSVGREGMEVDAIGIGSAVGREPISTP